MNRRAFLGLAGVAAAGFVMDPERLLWRPDVKSYHFITRPFRVGDLVYRHPANGLTRWGLARGPITIELGGEFGVYDGARVVTYGVWTPATSAKENGQ